MQLHLREHWSDQFGFESDKSEHIFIGRIRELSSLKHAIRNNTSSTILVSSVRGIGKTTFVHKALSEIRNEIIPIFVNVGHTLRDARKDKETSVGREFLTSLIRATFLTEKFKKDKEIETLYYQSIGQYRKARELSDTNKTTTNRLIATSFQQNIEGNLVRIIFAISGVLFAAYGLFADNLSLKLLGLLGVLSLPFSLGFKFNWDLLKNFEQVQSNIDSFTIDDSPEYLETKFEQWLEGKKEEQKLVFVIDELDKDEAKEALDAVKEYKNLFARSFAHFIFICNQKAFAATQESRLESKYPTLFTHVYYLPTPTSQEMNPYLDDVLQLKTPASETEELKKFLLFKSANDFFSLKNLLNDLSEFDSEGKQYIDTDTLKRMDKNYDDAVKIYQYIDRFYTYYSRAPKASWQANSRLQAEVFAFANTNLNREFTINLNASEHVTNLVLLLSRMGVLQAEDLSPTEQADISAQELERYSWTGQYRELELFDQLFPEDEALLEAMKQLIKLANDLNNLPTKYADSSFEEYTEIVEGNDGEDLSGVSLYKMYSKHLELYEYLSKPEERLYAKAEQTKEAAREIADTVAKVHIKIFDVFLSAAEKIVDAEGIETAISALDNTPTSSFLIKCWDTKFANKANGILRAQEGTKQLLVLKDIQMSSVTEKELAELRANPDILVINFLTNTSPTKRNPVVHINKLGSKRKATNVTNFINMQLPKSIQDLSEPLKVVVDHFV